MNKEHARLRHKTALLHSFTVLRHFFITTFVAFAICFAIPAFAASSEVAAAAKIAPDLASSVALGGSNEALIVFAEQADLSGAAKLPTKLEKGQYVYNALRSVAERTQAPMRKLLQERGIPFQSFYASI